jgi:hypothetical protein
MNKLHLSLSAAVVTLFLAAAPLLTAGPGPQYWKNASATVKAAPAPVVAPATAVSASCVQCTNCGTCCATKAQVKRAS